MKLENRIAIVTGAGGGIGQAVARRYLEEGAKVVLVDVKDIAPPDHPAASDATVHAIRADVTQRSDIERIVASTVTRFGGIDILFNNAGVFDMGPFLDESWDTYERLFATNVRGMFFLMQAVAKQMVADERRGKIINISSQAGRRGHALEPHYCASKAAVLSYTQSAALALARHGINVNGIAPGVIDTPMWDYVDAMFAKYEHLGPGEKKQQMSRSIPLGRLGQPGDLAGAAVFLASSDADYVTAQTLNVDGGNWMS